MNYKKLLKLPLALALIIYFLYLVVSATPAAWAAWAVHRAAPNVWLNAVDGSLWRGKAATAQVNIGNEAFALGQLNWRLNPFSLLLLKPCVEFDANLPTQLINGRFCQSLGGTTTVKNLNIDMPIATLNPLLPMRASGPVSLQVLEAKFNAAGYISSLAARFSWQQASVHNGDGWMNFGSFAATAEEDTQGGVQAKIFDIEGPYKTDLNATWAVEQDWKVIGTVAPGQGADDIVVQGLQILGEDVGDGSYRIQWP